MPVENSPARRGTPGGPSTFDLFSWSEGPDTTQVRAQVRHSATNDSAAFAAANDETLCNTPVGRPTIRMHQPAGGVSTITFGEQLTPEEAEAQLRRRPGSDLKRREMYGSGIFAESPAEASESGNGAMPDRTSVRVQQPAGGISQISFGGEDCVSPKKPVTVPEVAKQKELSGSLETTLDLRHRSFSNAKAKELVGSNIFGPAPPDVPRRVVNQTHVEVREEPDIKGSAEGVPRNVRTSVKVSNPAGGRSQISFGDEPNHSTARKVCDTKVAELTGNDIFREEPQTPTDDKPHHTLSSAKLKELTGSDIFADDKPVGRDCVGGIRKPPGGGSSIALV